MSQKLAFADDHFHDECGVFGVFGHPEAANLVYLGLYALQHRGQESAGIVSSDGKELYVHRAMGEPRGFRPLVLGKLTTPGGFVSWLVASETCAFDLLNAQYVREIEPGEMVRISKSGIESIRFAPEKPLQQCIFEHVYFSRPDSIIFGRSVNESREMLGRLLAREHPVDAA